MPEGDTLHRTASVLRKVLVGARVLEASLSHRTARFHASDLEGRTVVAVEALGKNLLVRFDDDHTLRSHLRMTGAWHAYALGEPWRKARGRGSIVLVTDRAVVVGFDVPVLERLSSTALRRHPELSQLGPDLLSETFDEEAALARYRTAPFVTLGEAVLDQRLACGIGNVYKSEGLFLCRLDPWATVGATSDEAITHLLATTRRLMQRNLEGRMRRTHHAFDAERYYVYGREGRACRTCAAPIGMARQGEAARSTYFCAACQRVDRPGRTTAHPYRSSC